MIGEYNIMKDLTLIIKRITAKAKGTVGLKAVADLEDIMNGTPTLDAQLTALCHLANSFNKEAIKLIKTYGKYSPAVVEKHAPIIYAQYVIPALEKMNDKIEVKNKVRLGKAQEDAEREVEVVKQLATITKSRTIGYARVSTNHQNLDRQLVELEQHKCDIIFKEKKSGKNVDRHEFHMMLQQLKAGDTIVISDMTRLARSTSDLFAIVEQLEKKQVSLKSIKESWLDTTTAQGKLMLTIFGGLAQFEREVMLERQAEGIAVAKANGTTFGRKLKDGADISTALRMLEEGKYTCTQIANMCNISRTTLWRKGKSLGIIE